MLAKRGAAATERLLRSWMANDPRILGSDVDVLEAIAAGRCDAGLTNHYYLARILEDDPTSRSRPAWPDQDGAGAHTNLSGVGLVKGTEHRADAIALMEHLTAPGGAARRSSPTASSPSTPTSRPPRTSATGRASSATRSTSSAPDACCPTRSR